MASKTLQDFFGNNVYPNEQELCIDIGELVSLVNGDSEYQDVASLPPEKIVTALIAYWFETNYSDTVTGNRLSQDKTVPLVSSSGSVRRSLVTRGDETQVKHDFSFSVYTKDNSDFNPDDLVSTESQSEFTPPPETEVENL